MSRVSLGAPPQLLGVVRYGNYRPWLLRHFFDSLCSYCLLRGEGLDVDHYEPQQYAPGRVDDPSNLLLGCSGCNGPGGKWDYHPLHATRRCRPRDTSGHLVIDVRNDDFAALFSIGPDGAITARPGQQRDRALWNITLLKLDLRDAWRKEVLDLAESCEDAILGLKEARRDRTLWLRLARRMGLVKTAGPSFSVDRWDRVLSRLLPELARRALLLEVFEIPVSKALALKLKEKKKDLRP